MDKETFWVLTVMYAFIAFVIAAVLHNDEMYGMATGDALTYGVFWPLFLVKYVGMGLVFLFSNGYTLLTN